jgi:hypothetical protein
MPSSTASPQFLYLLCESVHFCNGALGVKSLTVVPVSGVSLLSVVGLDAAT